MKTNTGRLCRSGTNAFINFLTSVLRHKERDTIFTMLTILSDPTNVWRILWCLRSLSVEIRKNPTTSSTAQSQLQLNGRNSTVCLHGPISTPNCMVRLLLLNTMVGSQPNLFQNLRNSQPISIGHDVIHTPAPFPLWGLLWQWWLSYPLHASVNSTNWLHTWTLNLNSSNLNQTEW